MAFLYKKKNKNHLPPPLSLLTTLLLLSSSLSMKVHSFVLFPTFLLSQVSRAVPSWDDYSQQQQQHQHAPNNTLISDPEGNKLGAVASQSEICSNIGGDILKKGGNAADATVSFFFFFFLLFFWRRVREGRGGREGGGRGRKKMNADIFFFLCNRLLRFCVWE